MGPVLCWRLSIGLLMAYPLHENPRKLETVIFQRRCPKSSRSRRGSFGEGHIYHEARKKTRRWLPRLAKWAEVGGSGRRWRQKPPFSLFTLWVCLVVVLFGFDLTLKIRHPYTWLWVGSFGARYIGLDSVRCIQEVACMCPRLLLLHSVPFLLFIGLIGCYVQLHVPLEPSNHILPMFLFVFFEGHFPWFSTDCVHWLRLFAAESKGTRPESYTPPQP